MAAAHLSWLNHAPSYSYRTALASSTPENTRVFEGSRLQLVGNIGDLRTASVEAVRAALTAQAATPSTPLIKIAGSELYAGALDVSYLKFAASAYDISPDPRDYVIVDMPIVEADIPNRNMDAFGYDELTSFNPIVGAPVWRTFCWKPTFADHDNKDPKKAKGVIFDAVLRQANGQWIVRELAGFCRQKDPRLVNDILTGKRNAYSMGALASYVACSCHGQIYDGQPFNACQEIRMGKGRTINIVGRGRVLVYDICSGVNFVETSSVEDPAFYGAKSDLLLQT